MVDKISPEERSENMRKIRSKDTKAEMIVRRLVHSMGYRYRLHDNVPGKPDLVFKKKKKAIFVHGCFWHKHEDEKCKIWRIPKSKVDYWLPKLNRNKQRDKENQEKLKEMGWNFLVLWECQLKDQANLKSVIKKFLDS